MSVPYSFAGDGGQAVPAWQLDANFTFLFNLIASGVAFQPLAAPPVSPALGQAYFDTTLGFARFWDGNIWRGLAAS